MAQQYHTVIPYVSLLIMRDNQVLLHERIGTSSYNGFWALPGGRLDGGESAQRAAIREAQEELGITVDPQNIKLVHVVHEYGVIGETMGLVFAITEWSGQLHNNEPEKHSDPEWFDVDHLPEKILPMGRHMINMVTSGQPYSQIGWPTNA